MNKSITIIAYNRPDCFEAMLRSLAKNDLNGWSILVGLEKSDTIDVQLELLEYFLPQANIFKRSWDVSYNVYGIARNSHDIITKAFELGSEYNLYLEEDIVVSPDVTNLADWHYEIESDAICLCLLSRPRKKSIVIENPDSAIISCRNKCFKLHSCPRGFSSYGFGVKKNIFFKHMSPNWFDERGWDMGVIDCINSSGMPVLLPYKSRSDHIGENGVNVQSKQHLNKLGLGNLEICQENISKDSFYLIQE